MEVATGAVNVANECFWLSTDGSSVFNLITHTHRDICSSCVCVYKYIEQINFEMLTTFRCLFINEAIVTCGSSGQRTHVPRNQTEEQHQHQYQYQNQPQYQLQSQWTISPLRGTTTLRATRQTASGNKNLKPQTRQSQRNRDRFLHSQGGTVA